MTAYGLMFHHFHDARHPSGQGAISADDLNRLLDAQGERVIGARAWAEGLLRGGLAEGAVCLTFDDGLRCQYDVALPVLEARGLTAFWFPYTAPLAGELDRLELYRYFRTVRFSDIDAFYEEFDAAWRTSAMATEVETALATFQASEYLREYTFYSDGDRRFRFIRDRVLGGEKFFTIMDAMLANDGFDRAAASKALWMGVEELRHLRDLGHIIGLHSHTHPTSLIDLDADRQMWEFETNAGWLERTLDLAADCVSYPCGAYDDRLIGILAGRGVRIGFQSRMGLSNDPMTMPRLDHTIALASLELRNPA